uniref:Structural maintenance of chromosomes protein 5 n=1 Tax=Glossina brevipalpis TaxID=37001 RepID=A0A1A9W6X1_9MUSC
MSNFGKIKTVYCKDFVTYSECVFRPSEYLNVIIGPNGSGKSTLVSAIVLCLGGEPKLLARSHFIRDYVKNGRSSAKICIEIYAERRHEGNSSDLKTVEFSRKFDKNNKSEFCINGRPYSHRDYLKAISKFNIQINNLCQFLPQDRVQDFAKMNPKEILANTISSVCNVEIVEGFEKLKELQNNEESSQSNHQKLVKKLAESKNRVNELNEELNRFNIRKETEAKLTACNVKKLKLETDELSTNIEESSKDWKLAETVLANYVKENKTIEAKQKELNNLATELTLHDEKQGADFKQAETNKAKILTKIEQLKAKIINEKIEFQKRKRDRAEREKNLQNDLQLLEVCVQDLKNLRVECSTDLEQANACNQSIEVYKADLKRLNQNHVRLNQKLEEYRPQIAHLKQQIEKLENVADQKLLFLQRKFPDVCEAIKWIEANESSFEAPVYKPIMLELNVRNPDHTKYLENTVAFRDFLAFSCESKKDISRLISELCVKRKLNVNIVQAPSNVTFVPDIPIENLRRYGFEAYLIDLVDGPHAVLGYLCSLFKLQNIPIGGDSVKEFIEQVPDNITVYFGGNVRYHVSTSRYSGEKIFSQMQIETINVLSSIDVQQIEQKKNRLNEFGRDIDSIRNRRTSLEAEMRKKELLYKQEKDKLGEINSRKCELSGKTEEFQKRKDRISDLKNQLKDPVQESDLKQNVAKYVKEMMSYQMAKVKALSILQKTIANKARSQARWHVFNTEKDAFSDTINTFLEKKKSAEDKVSLIKAKCESFKSKHQKKQQEIKRLTNESDPRKKNSENYQFYCDLPDCYEELKGLINDFSGRLDCMDNVNSEILREHENKLREISLIEQEIENVLKSSENRSAEIQTIYNNWFPAIAKVIETINKHFGDFMQSMGYVGEVKLMRKDVVSKSCCIFNVNEFLLWVSVLQYDFESFGIEILVQYRQNVPLQTLNRHVQSGGERAVAIAAFTLSMQHINHVPFRCVDEINQGMDARNERRIFDMLVDETTKTGCSQYFFVTPKILRNLKTHERLSVHLVFNGRMIESKDAFEFVIPTV